MNLNASLNTDWNLNRILLIFLVAICGQGVWGKPGVKTVARSVPKCQPVPQWLKDKKQIDIRVVFGYKDARPSRFVGDRHERLAFVQKIIAPCTEKNQACDFVRSAINADLFFKTVSGPQGQPMKIQLLVSHSSAGSDDEANRKDPLQVIQSEITRRTFLDGIESSEVVFYNGHSRFGGGPDFKPPQLNTLGEVDSGFYQKHKIGLSQLTDRLHSDRIEDDEKSTGAAKLQVLGLFSCASSQHFNKELATGGRVKLISSQRLLHYAEALDSSLKELSKLLDWSCPTELKVAANQKVKSKINSSRNRIK